MLSPQKAADRAGVSRKAIMDAIKAEKLRAVRSNEGLWQIQPESLEVWMESRPHRSNGGNVSASSTEEAATYDANLHDSTTPDLQGRITYLEARVAELGQERDNAQEALALERTRLERAETRLDAERDRADRATSSALEIIREAQRERERITARRDEARAQEEQKWEELRNRAESAEERVRVLKEADTKAKPGRGLLRRLWGYKK